MSAGIVMAKQAEYLPATGVELILYYIYKPNTALILPKNGFLGAVFYGNISSVSDLDTYRFNNWTPAVGTGLRIKFNRKNNSNLALDYGVSKDDWTFRVALSENF